MKLQTKLVIAWRVFTLFLLTLALVGIFESDGLSILLTLGIMTTTGLISLWIAKYRNADTRWAFIYGMAWGIFSIFYYAVLPTKAELAGFPDPEEKLTEEK